MAARRLPPLLALSLRPAAGKTSDRFGSSSLHPTDGRREPSLGRSAHPQRAIEARSRLYYLSARWTRGCLITFSRFNQNRLDSRNIFPSTLLQVSLCV
jgi:hypothetical protein